MADSQFSMPAGDHVDEILAEWALEKPDIDVSAQGIVGRVLRLATYFERDLASTFRQFGIRGGEFDVLATLRRCGGTDGLPASQLAQRCMLSSAAMTNRIDGLESVNLVERLVNPADRRIVRIALTPEGRDLIDRAFPSHVGNQDQMVDTLTVDERQLLVDLLRRLLQDYEATEGRGEPGPRSRPVQSPTTSRRPRRKRRESTSPGEA